MSTTVVHPGGLVLVDYWLGDTDGPTTEAIDAHLLECDACGAEFDAIVALASGVRDAFAQGRVASVVTPAFVARLRADGRRVREYHVPRGGSVVCSVAPDDDVLVSRIAAPLAGVARLDAVLTRSRGVEGEERLQDLPFDAAATEVLIVNPLAEVRRLPSHDIVVRLLAVDAGGERELGRYTFHHQASA
jgi:hypothetical protein